MVLNLTNRNSAQKKSSLAFDKVNELEFNIAIEIERTQIHFLSHVFVYVAVVVPLAL